MRLWPLPQLNLGASEHYQTPSTQQISGRLFFFRPYWRLLILFCALASALLGYAVPFFQKEILSLLMHPELSDSTHLILLIGGATVCALATLSFQLAVKLLSHRESRFYQIWMGAQLYNHSIRLNAATLHQTSTGELVALYATDVSGSAIFLDDVMPTTLSALLPICLVPAALYYLTHISLTVVLAIVCLLLALNFYLAFRQSHFLWWFKVLAAQRISLVNEWLQNLRALRILGWIEKFEEKIIQKRQQETANRLSMVTNGQVMNTITSSSSFLLNLVAVISLVIFYPQQLTPENMMAVMWVLTVFLSRPLRQVPWACVMWLDAWASVKRLEHFFSLPIENDVLLNSPAQAKEFIHNPTWALQIKGLTLKINDQYLLNHINLNITAGSFIVITGEVGSGKSVLLQSLLMETPAQFEQYSLQGHNTHHLSLAQLRQFFAYVPQGGFLMSATLRENVLFDYETNPSQDQDVELALKEAQFYPENENLTQGLNAEIGERGVNLSGGQRQRVSLARASFPRRPILLLDDCFSAVDVATEAQLITQLTQGSWKNCTRILVTHRMNIAAHADQVLFLQSGRLFAQGSYTELMRDCPQFALLVKS